MVITELPFEKKELCITAHNQNNLPTAPYTSFTDLQGNLKTLSKENQAKLKKSIIKYGIVFPAFIWQDGDTKYVIDAHQRIKTLGLLEKEGYFIPEVPFVLIEAKNKKEAGELLLQANSRYGTINDKTSFFEDFNIDLDYITDIEIPELKLVFDHNKRVKKGKGNIAQDVSFIESEEEALKVQHPELFVDKKDILVSFSGGKDSTFALFWAKTNFPEKNIVAFFSNTNVEFPGMASHIVNCCKFLDVEYKIIYPKDDMWLKIEDKGWPTGLFPWCQTYFIHNPIEKEYKKYDPNTFIILDGSAAKQASRLSIKTKTSGVKRLKNYDFYHPAFDISRNTIDTVLEKSEMPIWDGYAMGFVRTACWMCPQQCGEQAYALNENYPGLVNVIRRWEKK